MVFYIKYNHLRRVAVAKQIKVNLPALAYLAFININIQYFCLCRFVRSFDIGIVVSRGGGLACMKQDVLQSSWRYDMISILSTSISILIT